MINFLNKLKLVEHTPAFIYDELEIVAACRRLNNLCHEAGIVQLFPLKCHNVYGVLDIIAKHVDGFAASSLFEAQLARDILDEGKKIHFTSPSLQAKEVDMLLSLCDNISFNSLSQWQRWGKDFLGGVACGLRVNPQLSFVKDERYNPCRPNSKLGIPLKQLQEAFDANPKLFEGIEGLHFHTNCDSTDLSLLSKTIQHFDERIPALLHQSRYMNLGGGYLFGENNDNSEFLQGVQLLKNKYNLEVIIEPGADLIRNSCYLVAEIVDIFDSEDTKIAVLNTTVNHMPEVFEYQFKPDVAGERDDGYHKYILAGSTCLAGDIFGTYSFDKPLEMGEAIFFTSVGAYTLVKSHMFNGVNLPTIYALTADGQLELQKRYNYTDFKNRCGGNIKNENI